MSLEDQNQGNPQENIESEQLNEETYCLSSTNRSDLEKLGRKVLTDLDPHTDSERAESYFQDDSEIRPGGVYAMWISEDRRQKGTYRLYVQNRNAPGTDEYNNKIKSVIESSLNPPQEDSTD